MRQRYLTLGVLLVVFLTSAAWAVAQALAARPVPPTIVSGENVGFRIEAVRGATPIGHIVIKQNGQWVAAEIGSVQAPRQISQR